ncbi:MAG: triose-phosphate isomerase [Candidatus Geothermincolales bacterium]
MRRPLIAGNWKMYKTTGETEEYIHRLAALLRTQEEAEVAICPPFTSLQAASRALASCGREILLGAQDVYPEEEGAFTGEISPLMLKDLGVRLVIVGHSERRQILGETDDLVARKVRAVIKHRMTPILCVGETLEEREAGKAEEKVVGQVRADLEGLSPETVADMVIAYEPIWAIGTGKTATPEDAQEMNSLIRREIASLFGAEASARIRILYGGSVKPDNIASLMEMEDIDGALVGGASLDPESFARIVHFQG